MRGRPRPTANGNFLTVTQGGMKYSITYPPDKDNYVFYLIYVAPQPQPIGYRNNPPPNPPLKLLGVYTDPSTAVPVDLDIPNSSTDVPTPIPVPPSTIPTPVPITIAGLPQQPTAQQTAAYDNANSFAISVPQSPVRIYQGATPSQLVLIVTDPGNPGNIYIGFAPNVSPNTGLKIPAGSGVSIPINDVGSIYLVADAAGCKISGFYLV